MFFSQTLSALALTALVAASPLRQRNQAKALYFMTNDAAGNSIVAMPIGRDGTLSEGTTTPTGGKGGAAVNPQTGVPDGPDALGSQDSVKVVGDKLFVVNPGSNSLTMFKIDSRDPTKLTMAGEPAVLPGDFPVTAAVSERLSTVCVGLTGVRNGVSCAKYCDSGIEQMDALRPLGFETNQTTPPTGPLNSIADLLFSLDDRTLYASVKGNMTAAQPGGFSAYAVTRHGVSSQPQVSTFNGTAVLFGTTTIPGSASLFATDASFGAAILTPSASRHGAAPSLTLRTKTTVADNKANCWIAISPCTGTAFNTDVLANHLVEMDVRTGAIVREYQLDTPQTGMSDIAAAGEWVYGLAPTMNATNSVQVFSVAAGRGRAKQIQNFALKGTSRFIQGMAVFA